MWITSSVRVSLALGLYEWQLKWFAAEITLHPVWESQLFKAEWDHFTAKPTSFQKKTTCSFAWSSLLGRSPQRGVQLPFMSWSTVTTGLCRVYFSNDLAHCSVCLWAATTHQLIWSSTCCVWDRTSLTPLSVLNSILPRGWASAGWRQKLDGWDEKSREHRATVGWRCCIRKVGEMEDTRCTESGWEGVNCPYSSP